MKPINNYISESIYGNLGIDNLGEDYWVGIYNTQKIIGLSKAQRVDKSIVFNTDYIVLKDPRLLENGHLPNYDFKCTNPRTKDEAAEIKLEIRCNEFKSFENTPKCECLELYFNRDYATPKIQDFSSLSNCEFVKIKCFGTQNIKSLTGIRAKVAELNIQEDYSKNKLLSTATGLTFQPYKSDDVQLTTDYVFDDDIELLKKFFKTNTFVRPQSVHFLSAINDFSFLDDVKCTFQQFNFALPTLDENSPVYDPFINNLEKFFVNAVGIYDKHKHAGTFCRKFNARKTGINFCEAR